MSAQAWVTLTVGVLAVVGVVVTVRQRTRADNRAQSWARITWCLERTMSDDLDEVELGWSHYGTVAATPFIAKTDVNTLATLADRASGTALARKVRSEDTDVKIQGEGQL